MSANSTWWLRASLLAALLVGACSDDGGSGAPGTAECISSSDCSPWELCRDETCQARSCESDDDCRGGLCEETACVAPPDPPDAGGPDAGGSGDTSDDPLPLDTTPEDAADDGGSGDDTSAGDTADDTADDTATDAEADAALPPLAFTTEPTHGATDVPLNATLVVAFNQPMNEFTIVQGNFALYTQEGEQVERLPELDPDLRTVRLPSTPTSLLRPSTPYRLVLAPFIRSEAGEALGRERVVEFATVGYEGMNRFADLARTWAPTLYQAVRDPAIDRPTGVDFDGDLDPSNNLAQRGRARPAQVYWLVNETRSHYFLSYWIYWPGRTVPNVQTPWEHDGAGLTLVVRKLPGDSRGRFEAMMTYKAGHRVWLADRTHYPAGASVSRRNRPPTPEGEGRVPANDLDDRSVSIFLQAGDHTICLPTAGSTVSGGRCLPATGATAPFAAEETALILRVAPAEDGANPANANEYALLPFIENVWVYRNRAQGDNAFFSSNRAYSPPGDRPGTGIYLPGNLASDATSVTTDASPFTFARVDAASSSGTWWVDPAYAADANFQFEDGIDLAYCFNAMLGIDERDRVDCQ